MVLADKFPMEHTAAAIAGTIFLAVKCGVKYIKFYFLFTASHFY